MGKHIGLFGGSFNPVHSGHLVVAKSVFQQLSLDALWFIPAAQSPFKHKPEVDDQHRIAMLELAIQTQVEFKLDTRELTKPGPSYTIDTLNSIAKQHPDDNLYFLLGVDAWMGFERWREWPDILDLCRLIVMSRPGYPLPELSDRWQSKRVTNAQALSNGTFISLEVPASKASSSEIRRRIAKGDSTADFLSPSVKGYIDQHTLYQQNALLKPEVKGCQ